MDHEILGLEIEEFRELLLKEGSAKQLDKFNSLVSAYNGIPKDTTSTKNSTFEILIGLVFGIIPWLLGCIFIFYIIFIA